MKQLDPKTIMINSIERYSKDPKFNKEKFILSISGNIGLMKKSGRSAEAKELENYRKIIRRLNRR